MARKRKVEGFIDVTVHKVPGRMETVTVAEGATVEDALEAAQLTFSEGWELRVGDDEVDLDTEVEADDHIMLMQRVKGA